MSYTLAIFSRREMGHKGEATERYALVVRAGGETRVVRWYAAAQTARKAAIKLRRELVAT